MLSFDLFSPRLVPPTTAYPNLERHLRVAEHTLETFCEPDLLFLSSSAFQWPPNGNRLPRPSSARPLPRLLRDYRVPHRAERDQGKFYSSFLSVVESRESSTTVLFALN